MFCSYRKIKFCENLADQAGSVVVEERCLETAVWGSIRDGYSQIKKKSSRKIGIDRLRNGQLLHRHGFQQQSAIDQT